MMKVRLLQALVARRAGRLGFQMKKPNLIVPLPPELEPGVEAKRSRNVETLKELAKSAKHLLTQIPKKPYCEVCKQAKMYKTAGYAGAGATVVEAKEFGDHITWFFIGIARM